MDRQRSFKKQWCNENNINVRQLRYWQRVLKREVTGQNDSDNSGGQGRDTNEPANTASLASSSGGFYEMPSARQPNSKHRVISDDCENECLRPERRQSEVKPLVDAYFDYLRTLDMDDTDRSFPDDMMPWSETYRAYETSEMYNNLHLNLESEEEPPRRTYRKESMHPVS